MCTIPATSLPIYLPRAKIVNLMNMTLSSSAFCLIPTSDTLQRNLECRLIGNILPGLEARVQFSFQDIDTCGYDVRLDRSTLAGVMTLGKKCLFNARSRWRYEYDASQKLLTLIFSPNEMQETRRPFSLSITIEDGDTETCQCSYCKTETTSSNNYNYGYVYIAYGSSGSPWPAPPVFQNSNGWTTTTTSVFDNPGNGNKYCVVVVISACPSTNPVFFLTTDTTNVSDLITIVVYNATSTAITISGCDSYQLQSTGPASCKNPQNLNIEHSTYNFGTGDCTGTLYGNQSLYVVNFDGSQCNSQSCNGQPQMYVWTTNGGSFSSGSTASSIANEVISWFGYLGLSSSFPSQA